MTYSGHPHYDVIGIDVSKHQGRMLWDKAKPLIKFAIPRISYGSTIDSQFTINWSELQRLEIPHGAYVFARPHLSAQEHLNAVRSYLSHRGNIPITIDMERDPYGPVMDRKDIKRRMYEIVSEFDQFLGKKCMIYSSSGWWNQYMTNITDGYNIDLVGRPLWVANYTSGLRPLVPRGWPTWHIWQRSADGNMMGKYYGATGSQAIDINHFNGTYQQFCLFFGIPISIPTSEMVVNADIRVGPADSFPLFGKANGQIPEHEVVRDDMGKRWAKITAYVKMD